jgi:hypothetical protein
MKVVDPPQTLMISLDILALATRLSQTRQRDKYDATHGY